MIITIDLETCPAQNPAVREEIAATITHPANISKAETIAAWHAEKKPAAVEEAWRKTSFDGAHGHICVVGVAFDDEPAQAIYSHEWHADEADVLRELFSHLNDRIQHQPNVRPRFVGHNLVEFDLRFLFQRCVVLGVRPSPYIPFAAKPWDDSVYDTMVRWGARAGSSLNKITKALGLGGKGDIDGSKVWDFVRDGGIAQVAEYCKNDVELTRSLYKRMTFATDAA